MSDLTKDDTPITLKDAAQHFGFSVWTLRGEADKGRLTIYRIGRRDYTTPNDVKEMIQLCRVEKKGRDFTSIRSANSGRSETEIASSALASAKETALMLRNGSGRTSGASTHQNRQARR